MNQLLDIWNALQELVGAGSVIVEQVTGAAPGGPTSIPLPKEK